MSTLTLLIQKERGDLCYLIISFFSVDLFLFTLIW